MHTCDVYSERISFSTVKSYYIIDRIFITLKFGPNQCDTLFSSDEIYVFSNEAQECSFACLSRLTTAVAHVCLWARNETLIIKKKKNWRERISFFGLSSSVHAIVAICVAAAFFFFFFFSFHSLHRWRRQRQFFRSYFNNNKLLIEWCTSTTKKSVVQMICPKCGRSLLAREGILQAGRKYHRHCWTCGELITWLDLLNQRLFYWD